MRINVFESSGTVGGGEFVGDNLTLQGPLILLGPYSEPLHAVPKYYVDNAASNLNANNITSGILPVERLPAFTGDATTTPGSSNITLSNTGITPGSIVKPIVDAKGRVIGSGVLTESDIPSIEFNKINVNRPSTVSGYGITDAVKLTADTTIRGNLILHANPVNLNHASTKQYVDSLVSVRGISVGDIIHKPYSTTPPGFLKCNGAEVDKATYANLYAVIGDRFKIDSIPGSGQPWRQQYQINNLQSGDIIGWTTGPSLPGALGNSQAIVTRNRVYLLGGHTGGNSANIVVSTVYTAPINSDGTLGSWSTGTSLPNNLSNSQVVVTKNRVYLLGGHNGSTAVSTVYTATINSDGTLGAWSIGAPLPGALIAPQAIVTRNRVYLLGGHNGSTTVSTVYTAPINSDGTLGAWSIGTSLPGALGSSQAIVTRNRVYLLGGHNGSTTVSTVYTAPINSDGTLGAWSIGAPLPGALDRSQAIVTRNRVYLLGGYNGSTWVQIVYTAPINSDGTLGSWSTGTQLPGLLGNSQAIVTRNRVYLLGGYNGSAWVSTVYTAPISGGLNDYSSYYDGTIELTSNTSTKFRLPDYTSFDREFNEHITSYIKF